MAIIKFGTVVVGARGTVGGMTLTSGKAGPYAKVWSKGANPRSTRQTSQRQKVSSLGDVWRGLTGTQRSDWDTWAADPAQARTNSLGVTYNMSGWNAFNMIGLNLLGAGASARTDPPTNTTPAAPVIDSFTFAEVATVATVEITYDPAQFSGGVGIVIIAAAVVGGMRQVNHRNWLQLVSGAADISGTMNFTGSWQNNLGTLGAGTQGFVQVYRQDDQGMRSAPAALLATYS